MTHQTLSLEKYWKLFTATLNVFSGSLCDRFQQAGAEHDGIFKGNQSIKALQAFR